MYVCVCLCVGMCVSMYLCMFVCVCVCVYVLLRYVFVSFALYFTSTMLLMCAIISAFLKYCLNLSVRVDVFITESLSTYVLCTCYIFTSI